MTEYVLYIIVLLGTVFYVFFTGSEIISAAAGRLQNSKAAHNDRETDGSTDKLSGYTESAPAILLGKVTAGTAAVSAAALLAVCRSPSGSPAAAVIAMTALFILIGGILPGVTGTEYAGKLYPVVSKPLLAAVRLLSPAASFLGRFIEKMPALTKPKEPVSPVIMEELRTLAEEIKEEGVFTERESELIRSAIEFTDVTAREIMTPRVDIDAFDIDEGTEALLTNSRLLRHSYFPVYRDSPDHMTGVLSSRRIIKAAVCGEEIDINELTEPLIFVFMTQTISSILHELRRMGRPMAVVTDEYGGTMGIITAEDIIEEIVGEIYDEKDETEEKIQDAGDGTYIVDGRTNIYDMFEFIGYTPRDFTSENTTAGGWAVEVTDRFPQKGDNFEYDLFSVTVTEAQATRVEKLLVKVNRLSEKEEDRTNKYKAAGGNRIRAAETNGMKDEKHQTETRI